MSDYRGHQGRRATAVEKGPLLHGTCDLLHICNARDSPRALSKAKEKDAYFFVDITVAGGPLTQSDWLWNAEGAGPFPWKKTQSFLCHIKGRQVKGIIKKSRIPSAGVKEQQGINH